MHSRKCSNILTRRYALVLIYFLSCVVTFALAGVTETLAAIPASKDTKNGVVKAVSSSSSARQARGGGWGWGGGGWGWGGHGAITLDPVSIISLLALGAFLINNILQLLQANASGRSLDVTDWDVPLILSDSQYMDENAAGSSSYWAPKTRKNFDMQQEVPSFSQFFENVGSLYYLHPKKRNMCIKKVVCNYMASKQARESANPSLRSWIFDMMLSTITHIVAPEITAEDRSNGVCSKFNKYCTDSILQDAKVTTENKVYGHVTRLASNFAISTFMSGLKDML